jgi:hypothetical protein
VAGKKVALYRALRTSFFKRLKNQPLPQAMADFSDFKKIGIPKGLGLWWRGGLEEGQSSSSKKVTLKPATA